jgi:hypothetical protein
MSHRSRSTRQGPSGLQIRLLAVRPTKREQERVRAWLSEAFAAAVARRLMSTREARTMPNDLQTDHSPSPVARTRRENEGIPGLRSRPFQDDAAGIACRRQEEASDTRAPLSEERRGPKEGA